MTGDPEHGATLPSLQSHMSRAEVPGKSDARPDGAGAPAMPGHLAPLGSPEVAPRGGSPRLGTLRETAASLRISERTLRREVAARRIHCVRIGRRLLFDPADVSRFVAARKE